MGWQLDPQRVRLAAFVVLFVAGLVLLFLALPKIWPMLQIFLLSALIALALNPVVRWQVRYGLPRWAAVINLLLVLILLISLFAVFLVPPLVTQFREFVADIPDYWTRLTSQVGQLLRRFPQVADTLNRPDFIRNLLQGAGSWAQAARNIFTNAVNAVTAAILIFITVFYLLLHPWPILYGLRGLWPRAWWPMLEHLGSEIAARIRSWVIGSLVLGLIIGVLDYLALLLINLFFTQDLPFILVFAILGGVLEIIPVVGPIIAAILPALVGFAVSPLLGIVVLGAFFLIQQLENNLIVPIVMHRALNMHPVSLIFSLVILSSLFGLFGAIIAVPVAAMLKVLYDEWYYPLIHDGDHPEIPPTTEPNSPAPAPAPAPKPEPDPVPDPPDDAG